VLELICIANKLEIGLVPIEEICSLAFDLQPIVLKKPESYFS